jgi:hypothetical protein
MCATIFGADICGRNVWFDGSLVWATDKVRQIGFIHNIVDDIRPSVVCLLVSSSLTPILLPVIVLG